MLILAQSLHLVNEEYTWERRHRSVPGRYRLIIIIDV